MNHSTGKPTVAEAARIYRMLEMGCIACRIQFGIKITAEVHHIVEGNRRLGHWFTLPLCPGHHRGVWPDFEVLGTDLVRPPVSLADGSKRFEAEYGTERELWERVQRELQLAVIWPVSKIVPRVVA